MELTLTVDAFIITQIPASICFGEIYTENGFNETASGTYYDTLQSVFGCDSIVELTLTVDAVIITQIPASICFGEIYNLNGFNETASGTYYDTLQSLSGCDSIVELTLTVDTLIFTPIVASICYGEIYNLNGFNETATGIYYDTLQSVSGCDSIVELTLTVNPIDTTFIVDSICYGTTYNSNGFNESTAGVYYKILQNVIGCDSIVELTLMVNSTTLTAANLVYNIPSNHVYNGSPQGIGQVTVDSLAVPNFDATIIVYYNGSDTVPTNAGTYTVTVNITAGTNYAAVTGLYLGVYTIAKKTLILADLVYTIPTNPNNVYNGLPQGILVTANTTSAPNFDGTIIVYYNVLTTTAPTDAGAYSVTIDIIAGNNYAAVTGLLLGVYTIDKKALIVSDLVISPILPDTVIYNGSPQGVAVSANTTYAPNFDGIITVNYSGVPNMPTNAGTYIVTVSILGGQNYATVPGLSLGNFTIAKKSLIATDLIDTIPNYHVYNGSPQGIGQVKVDTANGNNPNFDGVITIYYSGSTTVPTNAGTYNITVNITAGNNYATVTGIPLGTYTIAQKSLAAIDLIYIVPNSFNDVYNGLPQGIGLVTANSNVAPNFDGVITIKYNNSTTLPIDAGTYAVTVDIAAGNNYGIATGISLGNYIIYPATPTVADLTANPTLPTHFIYDGNPQNIAVSPLSSLVGFGTIDSIYYMGINNTTYQSDTAPTDAGNYEVYVNISAGMNYTAINDLFVGNFSIGGTVPTITDLFISPALPTSFIYNGNPQGITVSPQDNLTGFGNITTYYISTDGVTYPKDTIPPTDAGEYEVSVEISSGTNYDANNFVIGTYTIIPKTLTEADLIYTIPTDHIFNAMPQGIDTVMVNPAAAPNFDGIIIVKYDDIDDDEEAPTDAETYIVTVEIVAGANYAATEIELTETYTIGQKTVYVIIDNYTINQGDPLPKPTITYTGFLNPDSEDNCLSIQAVAMHTVMDGNTHGTWDIVFKEEAVLTNSNGTNYVLEHETGTLTIISVGIKDPSKQENNLKAYVENGYLYVSGLEEGKIWSVYTVTGSLLYQGIATSDKEETFLTVRGIYTIQSGKKVVKVVY